MDIDDRRNQRIHGGGPPRNSPSNDEIIGGDYYGRHNDDDDDDNNNNNEHYRKRRRVDDDYDIPLHEDDHRRRQYLPESNIRKEDRVARLERERRERMARLRAEDDGDGGVGYNEKSDAVKGRIIGRGAAGGLIGRETRQYNDEITTTTNTYQKVDIEGNDDGESDEDEQQMRVLLGFGGFGTTKGKAVADNQHGAARGAASKNKGRKYRQYMNRKGGFNRPLDKMK